MPLVTFTAIQSRISLYYMGEFFSGLDAKEV